MDDFILTEKATYNYFQSLLEGLDDLIVIDKT